MLETEQAWKVVITAGSIVVAVVAGIKILS